MATGRTDRNSGGRNTTASRQASRAGASGQQRRQQSRRPAPTREEEYRPTQKAPAEDTSLRDEIIVIVALLFGVLLVLSYFGICGSFGDMVNTVIFGLFGVFGYLFPFALFTLTLFGVANKHNRSVIRKLIYCSLLLICLAALVQMIIGGYSEKMGLTDYFTHSLITYTGKRPAYGGILGGFLCFVLCPFVGNVATIIILVALILILMILVAGKAIFTSLTKKGIEHHKEHRELRAESLAQEQEEAPATGGMRSRRHRQLQESEKLIAGNDNIYEETLAGIDKKPGFVDTILQKAAERKQQEETTGEAEVTSPSVQELAIEHLDAREIVSDTEYTREDFVTSELNRKFGAGDEEPDSFTVPREKSAPIATDRHIMVDDPAEEEKSVMDYTVDTTGLFDDEYDKEDNTSDIIVSDNVNKSASKDETTAPESAVTPEPAIASELTITPGQDTQEKIIPYEFPPISLLNKSKAGGKSDNSAELKSTVEKLQNTFKSFGVGVTVTDATCGPTVTRYELLPDQGVKVKTITALSDDIKLALAAAEIRIEAPIPGKAAVGIEVPNSVTSPVLLRDLLDSPEFKDAHSNLTFAVGKDIGGKTICFDIAGMPHMLIAGATGSGKSVCINALIMSILYKAKPSEVKMIMIDPKRVELIGYNSIPHLLVPVVTDVKKASAALNWAIAEMDDRYQRFADNGVNNLASYNRVVEERYFEEGNEGECPDRLPQILIIVDELNDLMMTANSKEVEAAIVRLTQLARASGIHVVLATQRPSVNVITGTIKANIPSRIAFSVSSIVDSRTIIDQAGAEKLLGKGDMLFYPQGYPKPVRLQGAYVSDKEVADVVAFIKSKYKEIKYNELINKQIETGAIAAESSSGSSAAQGEADTEDRDEYYADAGRFIIEKQKASIGMLQRVFKIGFNRAARIMDSLAEDGVVGPEEGTKPRRIMMNLKQFEAFLNGDAGEMSTQESTEEKSFEEQSFDEDVQTLS